MRLRQLTADIIEEIWQAVRVEFLSYEQASHRFGIKTKLVQKLIGKMKNDADYVTKIRK